MLAESVMFIKHIQKRRVKISVPLQRILVSILVTDNLLVHVWLFLQFLESHHGDTTVLQEMCEYLNFFCGKSGEEDVYTVYVATNFNAL